MKSLPVMGFVLLFLFSGSFSFAASKDIYGPVDPEKSFSSGPSGRTEPAPGTAGETRPNPGGYLVIGKFYGSTVDYYTDKVVYRNYGNWIEFVDSKTGKKVVLDAKDAEVRPLGAGGKRP